MIIARLKIQTGGNGKRCLVGATTSNLPHKIGTRLVLRRCADGTYELLELGPRERPRKFDSRMLDSFTDPPKEAVG